MIRKAVLWCLTFHLLSSPLFALNYSNPELKFKAKLPDNLEDVSIRVAVHGGLISLGQWNQSRSGLVKMVSLQDLGGAIGREDLSKKKDKPANVTLEKARWQTFDIDVFKVIETAGKVTTVTFNAQVPLKPHAVQVTVIGPAAEEASLRQEMQTVVASIEGARNWLTTDDRISRAASGGGRLIAFGCLLTIGVVAGLRKLFRR